MNLLDAVLLVVVLLFAVAGWRRGLIAGVFALAGFLAGGAAGIWLGPRVLPQLASAVLTAVVGVVVVLVLALAGQALGAYAGARLRSVLAWGPLRVVDSGAGAVLNAAGALVVAYVLGLAVVSSPLTPLAREVGSSQVLGSVQQVVPDVDPSWLSSFRGLLDAHGFPRVFEGLGEPTLPVDPPSGAAAAGGGVASAAGSVVKIVGEAPACSRGLEGTGFVYAAHRVMTNAHVVAGVDQPYVLAGGRRYAGRVVAFDPERDVAVLDVPRLAAPALAFDRASVPRSASLAVAGYPENGPYTVVAARARGRLNARGYDIYGSDYATRSIYSLYATVRPGNSGGPLLTADGRVAGVVFAASVEDASTGYALTADEVAPVAAAGRSATARVGTGSCTTQETEHTRV